MNNVSELFDVLYGGIRPDIPGHGGEECAKYLSKNTMLFETLLSTFMMIVVGIFGFKTFTMPKVFPRERCPKGKTALLVLLCLVFGVEVGFKVCSRQVLYLLNPCHVITLIQVRSSIIIIICYNKVFVGVFACFCSESVVVCNAEDIGSLCVWGISCHCIP